MVKFSKLVLLRTSVHISVLQPPDTKASGFGLIRVRSPLLAESLLFSSPPGTEMFQFPGLPPFGAMSSTWQVSPFGHLRIKSYLHLPAAYRSLSRPSSSSRAKASPIRSYILPILRYFRASGTLVSIHCKIYFTTPPVKELLQPFIVNHCQALRLKA